MKDFVALVFMSVAALSLSDGARVRRDEKYTTKYDNLNLDEILASDRLVNNYVRCLLDTGRCTSDATTLKSHITDALQTDCTKCSDKQKKGAEKVIKFLYKEKPEEWKLLQQKYDPENKYVQKYESSLKEIST